MKILIDMNLSPRWQKFLTEAGLQAAHWSELGAGDAPDLDIRLTPRRTTTSCSRMTWISLPFLPLRMARSQAWCNFARSNWLPILSDRILCRRSGNWPSELGSGALVTVEPKRTRIRVRLCASRAHRFSA
jgi:hypothetical protein